MSEQVTIRRRTPLEQLRYLAEKITGAGERYVALGALEEVEAERKAHQRVAEALREIIEKANGVGQHPLSTCPPGCVACELRVKGMAALAELDRVTR